MLNYKYNLKELIDILEENQATDKFIADIFSFSLICDQQVGLEEIVFDPHIATDSKLKYLEDEVKTKLGKYFYGFLKLLVTNNDIAYYEHIKQKFLDILSKEKNTNFVEIKSADSLDEESLSKIKKELDRILKESVIIYNTTSPKLLGGFIIQAGEKRLDLSLRGGLESLAKELTA